MMLAYLQNQSKEADPVDEIVEASIVGAGMWRSALSLTSVISERRRWRRQHKLPPDLNSGVA